MKPIGSITNIFPFIEPEDRLLVQSFIEEARDYADFAERLCNFVLANDASEAMAVFALSHFSLTDIAEGKEKFHEKYGQYSCIRPSVMMLNMTINNSWDWLVLQKEIDDAITSTTNPWIQFELYEVKKSCIRGIGIGNIEEDRIIGKMKDLIQHNKSLEFARSRIYCLIADQYRTDSNHQRALEEYESALQHALTYDDVVFASGVQIHMANLVKFTDSSKGLEILESAASKVNELGYLERQTGLFTIMGLIFEARGEYDAAVKSYEEALELRERVHPGHSPRFLPGTLSRTFRKMGHVKESLEWAKIALTSKPILSSLPSVGLQVSGNLNMSAALALLGRVEEAKSYCDIGSELVLNSGMESWLSGLYVCRGLIERAEGKLTDALENFQNALEIVERLENPIRINDCLFLLAETEIQYQIDNLESDGMLANHWISVMEEMARKKDLPGILGLALLLKTRIQSLQHNDKEVQATLGEVRELAKNPSTRFLQDQIEVRSSTYKPKRR
ncbi:MAG: tetratricopeptide repeat protein [Candidatus Thorarchaeota archaeon]|jgi:tetratricopeptide (TPR) repeat protein